MACGYLSHVAYFISFTTHCMKGSTFELNSGGSISVPSVKSRMPDTTGLLVVVSILAFMVMEKL